MASQSVARGESIAAFIPALELLIAQAMEEWKVPGLALAVVQDGAVAVLNAYGQRDVEAGLPVTLDTQFIICSITKTFTATGLALLVGEGRLDWARPVRDYVPEFRLHDDVATDRLTVLDLLCHHSGLPRHDWIWVPSDLTRAQMFSAMRHLEPNRDLRSVHQYSNLGYLVAGIVTERVSGTSWEEFIRKRLTGKLRMDVSFTAEDLARNADAAVPYSMDGDKRLRVPPFPISVAPAGGINASISGMANWARFLLAGGEFEGQRLLSAPLVREMQTPRVHVATSEFSEIGDTHYGLGFRCHHYRGERAVGHSGGWIGWSTLMTLLPDRGVGVVVLTNRAPSAVTEIVTNFVLDRLSGKPPVPWFDRLRERRRAFIAQLETDRQTRAAARRAGTRPSHDLADYAGDYEHPGYGRIAITQAGEALHWAYRGMSATLEHRHYDTFDLPEAPERLLPDRLPITFATDREGNIGRLSAPFEPLVRDIVFERVASGDCTDVAFRQACTGVFRHGPLASVVAQDAEGQLTLSPANQPTYRLRPFRDRMFSIVELPGFRVEFRRAADGAVDELIFHQPNGTFLAQRVKDA
jgi:CubicO group peptidase (beta-lactamase class C family)